MAKLVQDLAKNLLSQVRQIENMSTEEREMSMEPLSQTSSKEFSETHPCFEGIDQSESDKKDLLEYAKNPRGFLLLAGTNGSGKSYAAEAIYNMQTQYRLPFYDSDKALFVTQSALNIEWSGCPQEARLSIHKYLQTKFFVLDDLGTITPTDAFFNLLFEILDKRWRDKAKGTVITTNRNSNEIREMFGDAILSRISSGIIKRWNHKDRRAVLF